MDGLGGKRTVQLGESGRSKAPKVDGPGFKWTVQNEIKWAVQKRKVDGPQKMKLDVGGQKGMKVDGLKMRGGQKGMKVDGPQNCVGNIKKVKVDGLRMRGRSKRDESGRSSKLRG